MSWAHIIITRTDPNLSQQTRNRTRTRNPLKPVPD